MGEVKAALQALGSDVYQIDDGTGAIAVWTRSGNAMPKIGARLNVEGEFRSAFPLGAQLVPALKQQRRMQ